MNANVDKPCARWLLLELFFPKRIGRLSCWIRSGAVLVLQLGLIGASGSYGSELITLTLLLLTVCVYVLFWVVLPRMRDLSIHPLWLFLFLVPIVDMPFSLVLLFRPRPISSFAAQPPPLPKQGQLQLG